MRVDDFYRQHLRHTSCNIILQHLDHVAVQRLAERYRKWRSAKRPSVFQSAELEAVQPRN
jgi:hypothetical protein